MKYCQMDISNDIVSKMRQVLKIGPGLRYRGGPNGKGYGNGYPTLEELETQFKARIQSKRAKIN